DLPDLLRELRGLERRRGTGRDRADHRPGAHDDVAAAVAGVVAMLAQTAVPFFEFASSPGVEWPAGRARIAYGDEADALDANDEGLIEMHYLEVVADPSQAKACGVCKAPFIGPEFLRVHHQRVHSASGAAAIAADARQQEDQARHREAGRRELDEVLGTPCPT